MTKWGMASQQGEEERKKGRGRRIGGQGEWGRTGREGKESVTQASADVVKILM